MLKLKLHIFRLNLRVIGSVFILIFQLFVPFLAEESQASDKTFGIWVEAEGKVQPFSSVSNFFKYIAFVETAEFTDLYAQVYRGGRSWFKSDLADDGPYRHAKKEGFDPLRNTIDIAHSKGRKVHAWINTLRVAGNPDAPLFKKLGKNVALQDNFGNSLLSYDKSGKLPGKLGQHYKLGTPGIWLDPSHASLRKHIAQIVREILTSYPDIDGIHLDMVRSPIPMRVTKGANKLRFGYGVHAEDQFALAHPQYQKSGASKPTGPEWEAWRRSQTTLLVKEIRGVIDEIAPEKELSAAVVGKLTRAQDWAFQDWSGWLKEGLLDSVLPMAYTRKEDTLDKIARVAVANRNDKRVVLGLGAWLLVDNPKKIVNQIQLADKFEADGIALFSYANLHNPKGKKLLSLANSHFVSKSQALQN